MSDDATRAQYDALLRCRSWHVWPERNLVETQDFAVTLEPGVSAIGRASVVSYLPRSNPSEYAAHPGDLGPIVWRGEIPGVNVVRGSILKAPEDVIGIQFQHEPPRRGEIDVRVAVLLDKELGPDAVDTLRSMTLALLSLLNLRLPEYLVPVAPLSVSRLLESGRAVENNVQVAVARRDTLAPFDVREVLREFRDLVVEGQQAPKLRTALELYGSHFSERSPKVRFLLLVMALEVLTSPTPKHAAVLRLMDKWKAELLEVKAQFADRTPESLAFSALERELAFRRTDSLRGQVRALAGQVPDDSAATGDLPRRALHIYDRRSTLVHDGTLPAAELRDLEAEADLVVRVILEFVLSRKPDDAG